VKDKGVKGSAGEGDNGQKAKTASDAWILCGIVKDKRTGKNGFEFLIGWRAFQDSKYDTWEPITNLPGSENMTTEWKGVQQQVGRRLQNQNGTSIRD
jgi:hypothetical protein